MGALTRLAAHAPQRTQLKREWYLFRKYALRKKLARDFRIGLMAFLGVFLGAYFDERLRHVHLLDVSIGIGVAVLAVVIAAITILVGFLTDDYGRLLKETLGSWGEVFYPYRLVAFTSAAAILVAGIGLFVWPSSPGWAQALSLGLSLGLAAWSTAGAFDLVQITQDHGEIKMRLRPELQEARERGRKQRVG